MSKKRLVFDITDSNTIADSDNVGAYLRDSAGNLLTSTLNGAAQALDVNLTGSTGSIEVTATDLDIRDLTAASDSVAIGDGTDLLAVNADGSINVNSTNVGPVRFIQDGSPVDVLEDTVTPANNQPLPVKLTGTTGDINITAGDLNVQNEHTGANFDSIRIGDGTELVNITPNNDLQVVDYWDSAILPSLETVGTSAVQLVSSALANRKEVVVCNDSNQAVYLGGDNTVTTGSGYPLYPGDEIRLPLGPTAQLWAIGEKAAQDVRLLEGA
jgi:hypothetical protein